MKKFIGTLLFSSLLSFASAQQEVMYSHDWNQHTGIVKSFEFRQNIYVHPWLSIHPNPNGTSTEKETYILSEFRPIVTNLFGIWKITFTEKTTTTNQ